MYEKTKKESHIWQVVKKFEWPIAHTHTHIYIFMYI